MILHASLITDFAYYIPWLERRLSEGYFDRIDEKGNINRYPLSNIEQIFLHTKNPAMVYEHHKTLKRFPVIPVCWVSMLDSFCEPARDKRKKDEFSQIKRLSRALPVQAGYGPVFYNQDNTKESHLAHFRMLCMFLGTRIKGIWVDFQLNKKCQSDKRYGFRELSENEKQEILKEMRNEAKRYNLDVWVKPDYYNLTTHTIDIGETDGCPERCIYCLGSVNRKVYQMKRMSHSCDSSILFGKPASGCKLHIKDTVENECEQIDIFTAFGVS